MFRMRDVTKVYRTAMVETHALRGITGFVFQSFNLGIATDIARGPSQVTPLRAAAHPCA
jgi:hypothetical protein